MSHDPVSSPQHYKSHPSGVECIEITEHMGFCLGNVTKYLIRAPHKGNELQDKMKARWYLEREIDRRSRETWAAFPHDDRYEVSTLGSVRRIDTGRVRSLVPIKNGYLTFTLSAGGKRTLHYAHRAVVETFIGPIPDGKVVAHRDGDRTNNAIYNLRIDTISGNLKDTRMHGTHRIGGNAPWRKLSASQVDEIRTRTDSETSLAAEFNVSRATIGRVRRGESWFDPRLDRQRIFDEWLDGEPDADLAEAISALWRAGFSRSSHEDLRNVLGYIEREIARLEAES